MSDAMRLIQWIALALMLVGLLRALNWMFVKFSNWLYGEE